MQFFHVKKQVLVFCCTVFCCILAGFCNDLFAQQEDSPHQGWTICVAAGAAGIKTIDEKFSTLPYTGIAGDAALGVKYERPRFSNTLLFHYQTSIQQNDAKPERVLHQKRIDICYEGLYNLGGSGLEFQAGAGVNIVYSKRAYDAFINSSTNFDFAASLAPVIEAGILLRNFLGGIHISEKIRIPLVAGFLQPAFVDPNGQASNDRGQFSFRSFTKNARIAGPSSFFQLNSLLTIDKDISDKHRLSLAYEWDYYSIHYVNMLKNVCHRVVLVYSFKM